MGYKDLYQMALKAMKDLAVDQLELSDLYFDRMEEYKGKDAQGCWAVGRTHEETTAKLMSKINEIEAAEQTYVAERKAKRGKKK